MFTAALFTVVRYGNSPNAHQRRNKNDVYTYTHSHTHTEWNTTQPSERMSFAPAWMDLDVIILSEVRQRKTNVWYDLHVEFFKNDTNEFIYKTDS